jgi:Bladder cancer-related protein BC10
VSSYIPLLLLPLPLSLSPIHLTIFLFLTYFLNRPCIYCSLLLVILFASSCHWSGRCFVDFSHSPAEEGGLVSYASWFWPRIYSQTIKHDNLPNRGNATMIGFLGEITNSTIAALANAAIDGTKEKFIRSTASVERIMPYSAGIGIQWLRRLLGRHEWTLPCVGVNIRL